MTLELLIEESASQHETREQWLMALAAALRPAFAEQGSPLPEKVRLSCGFTSAGAGGKRIGECWADKSSATNHVEIFIKPDQVEPMDVAAIVLHELIHAALGLEAKHGPLFRKLATALGLEGKMTATVPGEKAKALLQPLLDEIGPYPHSLLSNKKIKKEAKQPAWKNVVCPDCGFTACVMVKQMDMGRVCCPVDGEVLLTKEERAGE